MTFWCVSPQSPIHLTWFLAQKKANVLCFFWIPCSWRYDCWLLRCDWLPGPTMFPPPCPLILTVTHYISLILDSSPSSNHHPPVETWIKQFGSVVPKLYTIHQIPLFWGCWILLRSFLLFAQHSWWQYFLKATLSNFDLSSGSGLMLHLFPRNHLLFSSLSILGEDHHF